MILHGNEFAPSLIYQVTIRAYCIHITVMTSEKQTPADKQVLTEMCLDGPLG